MPFHYCARTLRCFLSRLLPFPTGCEGYPDKIVRYRSPRVARAHNVYLSRTGSRSQKYPPHGRSQPAPRGRRRSRGCISLSCKNSIQKNHWKIHNALLLQPQHAATVRTKAIYHVLSLISPSSRNVIPQQPWQPLSPPLLSPSFHSRILGLLSLTRTPSASLSLAPCMSRRRRLRHHGRAGPQIFPAKQRGHGFLDEGIEESQARFCLGLLVSIRMVDLWVVATCRGCCRTYRSRAACRRLGRRRCLGRGMLRRSGRRVIGAGHVAFAGSEMSWLGLCE